MYEIKDKNGFRPLDTNLNPSTSVWKTYDTVIQKNEFGLDEIAFNLSDVILQGSSDSIEYMDQVASRLQVRFDGKKTWTDAYKACRDDKFRDKVEAQQKKDTSGKYYSVDPETNQLVFSPIFCSDHIGPLDQAAAKHLKWISED